MFNEVNMGRIIDESNRHLVFAHSQVHILSGRVLQKAVCFYLNKAPNQPEYDRIKECIFKALNIDPEGNRGMVAPQSKVHLILKGFDFFKTQYSKRPEDILTSDNVIEHMQSVEQFVGLECVRKPAVVRSKGLNDMAVVFMDVWDSQNGFHMCNIVNKIYHIGGKLIKVEYARPREFVPQCQKCWRWNHSTKGCHLNHERCARCGGGHCTANHNFHVTCCGEERKKTGIVGKCQHKLQCINCKGEHLSNDKKCVYKHHENDRAWHER
jgi:hypothetical protein